jgi:hypothetical protein
MIKMYRVLSGRDNPAVKLFIKEVPTVSKSAGSELLLQLIPPTASKLQGPDCVLVCRLGGPIPSTARKQQGPD